MNTTDPTVHVGANLTAARRTTGIIQDETATIQVRGEDAQETGIYMATTMQDFDPQAFGEWLGNQNSRVQAGVLAGMAITIDRLGHNGDLQMVHISDALRLDANQDAIDTFVCDLYGHWQAE